MRRRLTRSFLLVVAAALLSAGLGTLALASLTARDTVESELRDDAERLAASVTDDTFRGNNRRQLPLIRAVLRLQDAGVAVVPNNAAREPALVGELPPAVDLSLDELVGLEPGSVRSGSNGDIAWGVAAARSVDGLVIVGLSREVDYQLGPALRFFVLASVAVLVLSAVLARQVADRLTAPIRSAEVASRRLAAGDLSARLEPPDDAAGDELADLARSINSMAEALERSRGLERQFLLSVSHDLRTPLTSIRGYAEAIADGTVNDERAAADVILSESRRLERLVADLLDLAKLDAQRFSFALEPLDAVEELHSVVAGFTPDARDGGLTISYEGPSTLPVVADPDRFAQVMANLIENATKFADKAIVVGGSHVGASTTITVDDDGPGIDATDRPHVFERLYVARREPRRKETGSGLGLAICRELVTAMGGTIEVSEAAAGGARMTVTLPALDPDRST